MWPHGCTATGCIIKNDGDDKLYACPHLKISSVINDEKRG